MILEGQGQARSHLKSNVPWSHKWGPVQFCGLDFADVVKCTIMLADMSEWAEFNKVYVTYFAPDRLPARSAFGCSGLALGGRLEVECIARYP